MTVDVVVLGVELAAPPVVSEPVEPDGELVLPELELGVLELELPLPLVPGPPIELVPPLLLGEVLLLALLSLLPLGLVLAVLGLLLVLLLLEPGLVLAVLGLVGDVLLDELVEPGVPAGGVALCLLQALSERAAITVKVAAAHCVRDIFIRNS